MKCINIKDKLKCVGCTSCYNVCPKKAIKMVEDEKGFLYPQVDKEKCIDCGLCSNKCFFINKKEAGSDYIQKLYGVKLKDDNYRSISTSGGIFYALAKNIIDNNGVVYGAAYDNNMVVKHIRIDDNESIKKAMRSKYVQSDICDIYPLIKNDLKLGKKILITGTPCQISGLKTFFGDNENIFYCDIICHGVPSPKTFRDHISFLEKKYQKKIKNYNFRTKRRGWHSTNHLEEIQFDDNTIDFKSASSQSFKYLFYSCKTLRDSCFNCQFSSFERISDITIGDFWGVEKVNPSFDDNKGVSLVLVNSSKGEKLFYNIIDSIEYFETSRENAKQHNLMYPTKKPEGIDSFWSEYNSLGYEHILKKYTPYGTKNRIVYYIKNIIKKIIGRK